MGRKASDVGLTAYSRAMHNLVGKVHSGVRDADHPFWATGLRVWIPGKSESYSVCAYGVSGGRVNVDARPAAPFVFFGGCVIVIANMLVVHLLRRSIDKVAAVAYATVAITRKSPK